MAGTRDAVVNLGYLAMINTEQSWMAKEVLQQLASGPLPAWYKVEPAMKVKVLAAGDCLFHTDEKNPSVYFVRQGIIRMVYETADGKEWVKAFAEEGRFFASLTALSPHGKTSFSTYAVCESIIEQLPYAVLLELADSHAIWQKTIRRALEIYGFRKETRERELLTLSPEERYTGFMTNCAHIATRLSHKDLAGYIRVTPVALSRIKKRVRLAGTIPP